MEDNKLYAMTKEELEQYLTTISHTLNSDEDESELIKKIKDRLEFMSKVDESKMPEVSFEGAVSDKIENNIEPEE